jgi:hypothetical protein
MATVFLSFSNQDRELARSLRHALTNFGHEVWSFDEQIAPGERWQVAIFDRLKEVDAVAVIVSEASAKSGWIHQELGAAVAYAHERGRPVIIPIVTGDFPLPANLAQFRGLLLGMRALKKSHADSPKRLKEHLVSNSQGRKSGKKTATRFNLARPTLFRSRLTSSKTENESTNVGPTSGTDWLI